MTGWALLAAGVTDWRDRQGFIPAQRASYHISKFSGRLATGIPWINHSGFFRNPARTSAAPNAQ